MTADQVTALEQNVNDKVRARIPVGVREFAAGDPEIELVSRVWREAEKEGSALPCSLL